MRNSSFLFLVLLLISCSNASEKAEVQISTENDIAVELTFAGSVEAAHEREKFLSKKLLSFDIVLRFGGTERLNSKVILSTDSKYGRFDYTNGEYLIYKDGDVFYSEGAGPEERARFTAYTWSYFFLFPYKLSDPGTIWTDYKDETPISDNSVAHKLTFLSGTGDAPDDWYIAYSDKPSGLLDVAAYIVTAGGGTIEEAEEDPHAIEYDDYKMVDGIPISHRWTFWSWRQDQGLVKIFGDAELSNFQFIEMDENLFAVESPISDSDDLSDR